MPSPPTWDEQVVTERAQALHAVQMEIARQSFVRFLTYCKIESDNPANPGMVPWEAWDYLIERAAAWQTGQDEIILKARQLGFSWFSAMYYQWVANYHPASHVGIVSKGQDESKDILRRIRQIHTNLPIELQDPKAKFTSEFIEFSSGSIIRAHPSTEDAGVGFQYRVVGMDEVAFHPYAAQNHAALRPTMSAPGNQMLLFSTANPEMGQYGFFHDMWEKSTSGATNYTPIFIPWSARPGRDSEWYSKETASLSPDEAKAWYPSTPDEAFVGKMGLVYSMFSRDRHVQPAPVPWDACIRRVAGVDWGGGDPTAVVMLGLYRDKSGMQKIHQYGEFYERGQYDVSDVARFISDWDKKGRISAVVCDPTQNFAINTLYRTFHLPARKPEMTRKDQGIDHMKWLFSNDLLTISPDCVNTIAEFPGYRYRENTDPFSKEKYQTSTPVDHHADAMDAMRYGCLEYMAMMHYRQPVANLSGKRIARTAV